MKETRRGREKSWKSINHGIIFFFFLWMGTQNGYNVPFLESASLTKRKRNAMKRIKQIYKISKKGNKKKKKSCHLVPKVVIDLPIEGSRKYRRRERVPKGESSKGRKKGRNQYWWERSSCSTNIWKSESKVSCFPHPNNSETISSYNNPPPPLFSCSNNQIFDKHNKVKQWLLLTELPSATLSV